MDELLLFLIASSSLMKVKHVKLQQLYFQIWNRVSGVWKKLNL